MNEWSKKTLELVTTKNYLDQLQIIYPHEEGERDISEETLNSIRHSFEKKDKKGFLNKLLGLERFPYKDSYIAFLRKDRTALDTLVQIGTKKTSTILKSPVIVRGNGSDLAKSVKGMLKQPPNSAIKGEKPPRGT